MTTRTASCMCGQLSATCEGDPLRVSVCHCLDCQKRSGSSFAAQARFPKDSVVLAGDSSVWERTGDEGGKAQMHFCPICGSNVFFTADFDPETIAVTVGCFADPAFPPPEYSVYETRKHGWVSIESEATEHYD